MTAAALAKAGGRPVRTGLAIGAAAFALVDEGVVSALFTPPPWAYPIESHVRGAVGHLAYGVAAGAMLAVARARGDEVGKAASQVTGRRKPPPRRSKEESMENKYALLGEKNSFTNASVPVALRFNRIVNCCIRHLRSQ
jgi:hypothetical protein